MRLIGLSDNLHMVGMEFLTYRKRHCLAEISQLGSGHRADALDGRRSKIIGFREQEFVASGMIGTR